MAQQRQPRRPVTDEDYEAVKRLHQQGHTRNEIARRLNRSGKTVTEIANKLGLDFERSQTQVGTEARKADAAARRSALQHDTLEAAQQLMAQLFKPALVYNFGGKENTYNQHILEKPSYGDQRSLAVAIQSLVNSSVRLAEFDRTTTTGVDAGKTMLGQLGDALNLAYEALNEAEAASDATES